MMRNKVPWTIWAAIAILAMFLLTWLALAPGAMSTQMGERIVNGSFEGQFSADGVAEGWGRFDNGGAANYGWYRDDWSAVVFDGASSQLIEINTRGLVAADPDRYAGIYQVVGGLVPGTIYEFSLRGMLRALEGDPDTANWSYTVEWGYTPGNNPDWRAVSNWQELPWATIYPRLSPGRFLSHSTMLTAPADTLTLFIRARKKWGTVERELDLNLDAVSLVGVQSPQAAAPIVEFTPFSNPGLGNLTAVPVRASAEAGLSALELFDNGTPIGRAEGNGQGQVEFWFGWQPTTAGEHTLRVVVRDTLGREATATTRIAIVPLREHLQNGGFEGAFQPDGSAPGWSRFDSGGSAHYRFGAETWPAAVYEGVSSQSIAISTDGLTSSEPDRYAGIAQTVTGLVPGATYNLSLRGLLRARDGDEDMMNYAYRVQWGYTADGNRDWTRVTNWQEIPWDTVYPSSNPGAFMRFNTTLQGPESGTITLFIRAWKKWGTVNREFVLSLDGVSLVGP